MATENLATDTTLEYVVLEKMSADLKDDGTLAKEVYTAYGTWKWTAELQGDYAD